LLVVLEEGEVGGGGGGKFDAEVGDGSLVGFVVAARSLLPAVAATTPPANDGAASVLADDEDSVIPTVLEGKALATLF